MVEKIAIEIALEGGAELQQQFKAATSSIAKLGSTAEEAFAGASAAAQKFSASSSDLQQVESAIRALSARARDSSTSFSQLAQNYDAARQSAAALVPAAVKVEQALKTTGNAAAQTRSEVAALAQGLNALGAGPLGRMATAIANIGTKLGALAVAAAAVGGSAAALIRFATAAEETEKALTQLQKVSGQSFQSLSALSNVFASGGTSLKQFATEFGNLSEKIAAAGEQAAKQGAIKQQAEDVAKGLKVTELGAITLNERVTALLETLSRVPPTQQWFALADVFKQLKDTGQQLEAARIGQALGLSPETIATLSQGSEVLRQLQAQAEQLGLTLTSSNQQALGEMSQGWNQFTSLVSAAFQKIGAEAAPAITAILAGFQPVLQQIVSDFQNLPLDQAVANLGTRLAPAFEALGAAITPVVTALGTAAGTAFADAVLAAITSGLTPKESLWQAILDDFTKFGESIVQNAKILGQKILQALGLGGGGAPAAGGGGGAPRLAGGGFIGGRGSGTSDSNLAWVSRGEHIMPARVVRQPGVLGFLEGLRRGGGIPGYAEGGPVRASAGVLSAINSIGRVGSVLESASNTLMDMHDRTMFGLQDAVTALISAVSKVGERQRQTIDRLLQTFSQTADNLQQQLHNLAIGGKASGGLLGGIGTGTSDSNLAWVSRGEYITPARAVGQPGVLAFLEALRRSGGNLTAVLNGMGQFALGGMVPRAMPAFATGGLAGGSHVTIQFPGLPAIGGLRASSDVVDQLHKAAALAQVRSGGRKPSRYS